MIYVSTDLETSALDPERGLILELAMVVENTEEATPVEELPFFHVIVAPDPELNFGEGICTPGKIVGEAIALAMNARLITRIAGGKVHGTYEPGQVRERGSAQDQASMWLDSKCGVGRIVMAAKNGAGFDLIWLREHMPYLARRFMHRVIDPGSVLIDWSKSGPPSMKDLLAGREPSHTALEDARDNIRVLRRAYTSLPVMSGPPVSTLTYRT